MCLDYRKVNKQLVTDIHLLPNLELVENVAGSEYYALLDLKDAYYLVMLDEESSDLTTFSEGIGLYRFKRLPFGSKLFSIHLRKTITGSSNTIV